MVGVEWSVAPSWRESKTRKPREETMSRIRFPSAAVLMLVAAGCTARATEPVLPDSGPAYGGYGLGSGNFADTTEVAGDAAGGYGLGSGVVADTTGAGRAAGGYGLGSGN
jgi:hypothetical protein